MREIPTISLERMNNGAHFLFMSNIVARAEADEVLKTKTTTEVNDLKAAVQQEDRDLKISQKSLLTDEIAKADAQRASIYIGYKKAVQGMLRVTDETMTQAAKVLSQHIKDYAIDTRMQLDRETGLLINFITDLEGKYKSEVETLKLTAFVTNLKENNERVRELTASRTDERIGITVGALKASRKASDAAYRSLVKMVNALALVEGDTEYLPFIEYMSTEIMHYKREVINRKAKPSGVVPRIPIGNTDKATNEETNAFRNGGMPAISI